MSLTDVEERRRFFDNTDFVTIASELRRVGQGVVIVAGATGVGKTSFGATLATALSGSGNKVIYLAELEEIRGVQWVYTPALEDLLSTISPGDTVFVDRSLYSGPAVRRLAESNIVVSTIHEGDPAICELDRLSPLRLFHLGRKGFETLAQAGPLLAEPSYQFTASFTA